MNQIDLQWLRNWSQYVLFYNYSNYTSGHLLFQAPTNTQKKGLLDVGIFHGSWGVEWKEKSSYQDSLGNRNKILKKMCLGSDFKGHLLAVAGDCFLSTLPSHGLKANTVHLYCHFAALQEGFYFRF